MLTRLQIIPVIDLRAGHVVLANGLSRQDYPLLNSILTAETGLQAVVDDLMSWYAFPMIYIADLDAIRGKGHHHALLAALSHAYPQLEIWLDAGIKTVQDTLAYQDLPNIHLVLGTETLTDMTLLKSDQAILSLDMKNMQWLGQSGADAYPELWPDRVIVMSLDHVGQQQGPAITLLQQLTQQYGEKKWFMAGGVRDKDDLADVGRKGAKGVLIATALHRGQIDLETVKAHMG